MKAVLLDREGTIIIDPSFDRVDAPEKAQLLPNTLAALKLLAQHGYGAVIITNQTNIAQGRLTEQGFWDLHKYILKLIEPSGITVLKTYVCPHSADAGCDCRKPKPALLLQALGEFDLDPTETYMVGDRDSDITAGRNAGTKTILVKTGKHPTAMEADYTAADLLDAAKYIVDSE
jgi:D-glycero-D-manno-heptose 1,7-bisphosphate phosphatase